MDTEKELIGKIRQLRQIKPKEDWVVLTKKQLFEHLGPAQYSPANYEFFTNIRILRNVFFRPILIPVFALFLFFGTFGLAQKALPGDLLYPIKKLSEKGQAIFVSEKEKPKAQLELVNKRLEELAKIAEGNQIQKLAALEEVKATKRIAKEELSRAIKDKPKEEVVKIAQEVAVKLKEVEEKEKRVFAVLGLEPLATETVETSEKIIVEILIRDYEKQTLTEEQQKILAEAKELYEAGNFTQALERILILRYPQE